MTFFLFSSLQEGVTNVSINGQEAMLLDVFVPLYPSLYQAMIRSVLPTGFVCHYSRYPSGSRAGACKFTYDSLIWRYIIVLGFLFTVLRWLVLVSRYYCFAWQSSLASVAEGHIHFSFLARSVAPASDNPPV